MRLLRGDSPEATALLDRSTRFEESVDDAKYPPVMTRDTILKAAAQEIELNGMTLFRVKRVAYAAGISVALLYSYFDDREDLIACAISHRFREVLRGLAETFTSPLMCVKTTEDLRQALRIIIAEAQVPARSEAGRR